MSGEHWRSRLYRRLIGPICQFVASTKQATPLSNPIPAPDIAVTIDLPSFKSKRILERNDLEPVSPSRRDIKIWKSSVSIAVRPSIRSPIYYTTDSSTPCDAFHETFFEILDKIVWLFLTFWS